MANLEQLNVLRQGVKEWNAWRKEHIDRTIDLTHANLNGAFLQDANLWRADLHDADLHDAELMRAGASAHGSGEYSV